MGRRKSHLSRRTRDAKRIRLKRAQETDEERSERVAKMREYKTKNLNQFRKFNKNLSYLSDSLIAMENGIRSYNMKGKKRIRYRSAETFEQNSLMNEDRLREERNILLSDHIEDGELNEDIEQTKMAHTRYICIKDLSKLLHNVETVSKDSETQLCDEKDWVRATKARMQREKAWLDSMKDKLNAKRQWVSRSDPNTPIIKIEDDHEECLCDDCIII